MAITFDIRLPHYNRGFHLITSDITRQLPELPEHGLLVVFIKHTSAALTLNENADPTVRTDFQTFFNQLVPDGAHYFLHTDEGDDDMSVKVQFRYIKGIAEKLLYPDLIIIKIILFISQFKMPIET